MKASFIEPMLLQPTDNLPEGAAWRYDLKLVGYRASSIKSASNVTLFSRNNKAFTAQYPAIVKALADMPDETVLDGEVVALDENGRPSFNILQNYRSSDAPIDYFVFDVL